MSLWEGKELVKIVPWADGEAILDVFESLGPDDTVIIESVRASPGQSPIKSFVFGQNDGYWLGISRMASRLTKCPPPIKFQPTIWQAPWRDRLPRGSDNKSYDARKRECKVIAQELYPDHKIIKAHADAVLIGHFFLNHHERA